jgi:pimeloyl-ACP methyl ester carboxylesterase
MFLAESWVKAGLRRRLDGDSCLVPQVVFRSERRKYRREHAAMQTVASADGTSIAFERGGSGADLVLVHGTAADRARWAAIRPQLEEHFTVTAVDRRGRGDSGDGRNYAAEREYDDIVAVVDALDPPVLLFGHSFGAICSLEAALRTDRLDGLILYEPPMFEGQAASPEKVQRPGKAPSNVRMLDARPAPVPPVRFTIIRTFFLSMTAISSSGLARKFISSPRETPPPLVFAHDRWVCMSMAGKRDRATFVSGTWSMLFG